MRRIDPRRLAAAGIAVWLAAAAPVRSAPSNDALIGELEAVRRESIAAAAAAQQHERALAALDHRLALLQGDAAARQRGLDDSRAQQAQLLGALERLARDPPEEFALAPEGPVARLRSGMLMAAAIPALRIEAQALTTEIGRVARLRVEIPQAEAAVATRREALAANHELLAHLAARRIELTGKLVREDAAADAKSRGLADHAASLTELIKQADAEFARREKQNDPTKPKALRPPGPARLELLPPVAGAIDRHFATPDDAGEATQQLAFAAVTQGEVIAPFDGKVVFAGAYRTSGLVLIIRHGDLYHTVLAGLGRIDVRPGEWVLAGEPVGVMPDLAKNQPGTRLSFELRRESRTIDPEPWLSPGLSPGGNSAGDGNGRDE